MAQKPASTTTYDKSAGESIKSTQRRDEQKPPMGGRADSGQPNAADNKDRAAKADTRDHETKGAQKDAGMNKGTEGTHAQGQGDGEQRERSGTQAGKDTENTEDRASAGDTASGSSDDERNRSGRSSTSGGM